MATNPLIKLKEAGQSVWLDFLSRDLLRSGKLKRMIEEDGISGVTSNPTIFQKAIGESELYDGQLGEMVGRGVTDEKELFLGLAMEDVAQAADLLLPVYDRTGHGDGFVSIEVSPDLAYDADATVNEGRRLFTGIGRKNVLVKVPATEQGLDAIERLTAEGINVNVTLLFSVKRYRKVAEAYIRGIEKRVSSGQPVAELTSFASFFVSRVDTLVDKLLDEKAGLKSLHGGAGVSNCKLAYRSYREIFLGEGLGPIKEKGARAQRLVWGSTGTKDPMYSDIKYVEELIAPDTVNTMPEETMNKFKDHGRVRVSIEEGLAEAGELFEELASIGIDMDDVGLSLEKEGVKKFQESYYDVLRTVAKKKDAFLGREAA